MNIKINGLADQLILKDILVLGRIYFSDAVFVEEGAEMEVFFWEEEIFGKTVIHGRLNEIFQTSGYGKKGDFYKNKKYAYLSCFMKLLEIVANRSQPWGLLNGMRPTKLVHSLKKQGCDEKEIRRLMKSEYLVSEEKIDLLLDVAQRQLNVVPDLYHLEKEVSIYIGIPFCPTRCTYCTFAAYATEPFKKWIAPFVLALIGEIQEMGAYLLEKNIKVSSLYFGGGTATSLDADQLGKLFRAVYKHLVPKSGLREVTVEAGRPDTITKEKLELIKSFGIDRISINPQTFHQKTLNTIGRHHSVEDVLEKYHMAKGMGIDNINMDLIVGLPDEGPHELEYSLNKMASLSPNSLTVHMLAYKRKSKISQDKGLYTTASLEELQMMGEMTYDFARKNGYMPYYLYRQKNISANMENIGYSKPGFESVYNILMMEEAQNILGFGVGASSKFLIGTSVHNPRDIKTYLENYPSYVEKKVQLLETSFAIGAEAFSKNK